MSEQGDELEEVDPEEAASLIAGGAYLLDVREPDEWEAGHAPEAHHIPLGDLEARYGEIPSDQTIVCVCRGGGRSARAAAALSTVGLTTINLAGGMRAWESSGLPVVVADDGAGTVI
ncbi:MAG TPA: rhodanese-like domain-containing protein [Acidimicrobiales bacterium]